VPRCHLLRPDPGAGASPPRHTIRNIRPNEPVDRGGEIVESGTPAGEALRDARLDALPCWLMIHRSMKLSFTGRDASLPQSLPAVFISTKSVAFQSLLQKLR